MFGMIFVFFFNDTATTEIYTLSLHDALPILPGTAPRNSGVDPRENDDARPTFLPIFPMWVTSGNSRSEEHTSELQSRLHLVCRLLLEKKKKKQRTREAAWDVSEPRAQRSL